MYTLQLITIPRVVVVVVFVVGYDLGQIDQILHGF